ncbi:30174_t:CDS:2, partial [Gigaspora margarita]
MEEFVPKASFDNEEASSNCTCELTSNFDKETEDKINEFSE